MSVLSDQLAAVLILDSESPWILTIASNLIYLFIIYLFIKMFFLMADTKYQCSPFLHGIISAFSGTSNGKLSVRKKGKKHFGMSLAAKITVSCSFVHDEPG